jgi:hypothetical protein
MIGGEWGATNGAATGVPMLAEAHWQFYAKSQSQRGLEV